MRFDKFTLKAQEVIQAAQQLAERFGQQQIEPEHLVRAILEQKEGVIPPLLGKIGADQNQLINSFESFLENLPKISGGGYGQPALSQRAKAVLDKSFIEAEQVKDEFVSLEHILLAVTDEEGGAGADILAAAGITRDMILKALVDIRGGRGLPTKTRKTSIRHWNVSV